MANEPSWIGLEAGPQSHWQHGCNDAREGREPRIPCPFASGFAANQRNEGYMNGWKFGRTHRPVHQPAENEGSEA